VANDDFIWRFTPSRTDLSVLEEIFVQRRGMLADLVERVRESALTGNKHQVLLVGPRGIGKTHLITLLHHRVSQDLELAVKVRIAWLLEDETITSFVQLLKRIYESLAEAYPAEYSLGWLEDVLDRRPGQIQKALEASLIENLEGKTLLIIIENLDLVFDGFGEQDEKQFRACLQNHPFTSIIASSQRLFKGVKAREQPFFGFFATEHLRPLSVPDATELLCRIARHREQDDLVAFLASPEGRARVRALHHIAGGNHRIYIALSGFITRDSLEELAGPFEKMVDELTPYYQERMRWLAPQQRQIVEYLCAREETCTPKEIARHLLTTENTVSSQLKKLLELGYVLRSPRGRESLYELAEPLMRLASEVKEKRSKPLRLLVNFLRVWYRPDVLPQLLAKAGTPSLRAHLQAAISESRSKPDPRLRLLQREADNARQSAKTDELIQILEELANASGSPKAWIESAVHHILVRKDFNAAIECTGEALAIEPENAEAWTLRGGALVSLNAPEDALPCLTKALTIDPQSALAWSLKGHTLHALGRYEAALECFRRSAAIQPHEAIGWLVEGACHDKFGNVNAAAECYGNAVLADPTSAEPWVRRGVALVSLGRYEDAIECAESALGIEPRRALALLTKGVSLASIGQDLRAIECLEECLVADPSSALALVVRANSLNNVGRFDAALECIERGLAANAGDTEFWIVKAVILCNLDRLDAGIECADKALEIDPHHTGAWTCKGDLLCGLSRVDDAIVCYDKVLEIDPRDKSAWYKKSDKLEDLGKYEEAITCAETAVKLDASYTEAWHVKARCLEALGRASEAIDCFRQVVEIDPTCGLAWENQGNALQSQGRLRDAIDCYEKALAVEPDETHLLLNKGHAFLRLGRGDAARKCYESVLQLDSTDPVTTSYRCEAMFGLRLWEEGLAALSEASRLQPGDRRYDFADIVDIFLRQNEGSEDLDQHLARLIQACSETGMLADLGDGLVRSLRFIGFQPLDPVKLGAWRDAWLELGQGQPDLEVPLRILRAGVDYTIRGDESVLLDLLSAERRILRQAMGLDSAADC
jgi:tetratricopeptide (TPR) repeat protein